MLNKNTLIYPRRWGSSSIGIRYGYKWLLKKRIIIEPELLIDYELNSISGGHLDWFLVVNAGYRF